MNKLAEPVTVMDPVQMGGRTLTLQEDDRLVVTVPGGREDIIFGIADASMAQWERLYPPMTQGDFPEDCGLIAQVKAEGVVSDLYTVEGTKPPSAKGYQDVLISITHEVCANCHLKCKPKRAYQVGSRQASTSSPVYFGKVLAYRDIREC